MIKKSLRLILKENKANEHNQYPIWLRITINRATNFISTGEYVNINQWDKKNQCVKNHPLQDEINISINGLKEKVSKHMATLNLEGKSTTAKAVKELFCNHGNIDKNNFFDFSYAYLVEVKHKKTDSTIEANKRFLRNLELYLGHRRLTFGEVTPEFLHKYEQYLRDKVSNNYTATLFKDFRMFFNAARKRKITDNYPFANYEKPVYAAPVKDYLSKAEIRKLLKHVKKPLVPTIKQTTLYFLLGISTGLRMSDWFKFNTEKHINDGWILLRAEKNGNWVTMPPNAIFKEILPLLKTIPLTIEEPTINEKLKEIAKELNINKHLTTHTARHTFAVTNCAENGISCETCAELMGITVDTCVKNYYRVTKAKILAETTKGWKQII